VWLNAGAQDSTPRRKSMKARGFSEPAGTLMEAHPTPVFTQLSARKGTNSRSSERPRGEASFHLVTFWLEVFTDDLLAYQGRRSGFSGLWVCRLVWRWAPA